jgi:hypothetical protein
MRIRTILMLLFCVLVAAFIALNWGELSRPTTLNMGFVQTQGPLGLVMFGLMLLAILVFGAYALATQTASLLETRNHAKEMKTQRELAEKAEVSRFTELRTLIERSENDSRTQATELRQFVTEQLQTLQKDMRIAIENSGNTLAAYMGELEDRMEHGSFYAAPTSPEKMPPTG